MPTFLYRGYNAQGQKTCGSLSCPNRAQAETAIAQLSVTDYTLYESQTRYDTRPYALAKPEELALFCREAAALFDADLPKSEGLTLLASQIKNETFRQALNEVCLHLSQGLTPARALGMYDHVFGAFFTYMAAAGENNGTLTETLAAMADFYEQEVLLRKRLRQQLLYPVARMILLWCVTFVVIGSCMPIFDGILADMNADASQTNALFRFLHNLYTHGWFIAVLTASLAVLAWVTSRYPSARRFWDKQLATNPVLQKLALPICTARLARGFSLILHRGAPLMVTDACLRTMIYNYCLETKVGSAINRLRSGSDLLTVLESIKNFPPFFPVSFSKMALVGNQTGRMAEMMDHAADWFTEEVDRIVNRIAAFLEPALLTLLALAAGLPLLSILLTLLEAIKQATP